jgi:CBS domain-containing protein
MKVKDILRRKGNHVIAVSPQSSVLDALKLMAEKNVAGVLVMEGEKLVGIFTERDYARKIILKGKTSADSKISEVMVSNLITITPDNDLTDCMQLMTNKNIRHLPVVENGKLIGLISIGDVVRTIIEEQKDVIGHLEQYIAGA